MVIGAKDALKLVGISVVVFCAVFVCTLFLNFYLDVRGAETLLSTPEEYALYNAQVSTAKFVCGLSGGCLSLIAAVMIVFYVGLYIDTHIKFLGILKAMGWSAEKTSLRFWVFGLSVFCGAVLGFVLSFAAMPLVYGEMCGEDLPSVTVRFHFSLLVCLVFVPSVAYAAIACLYAAFRLRRPVGEMLKSVGKTGKAVHSSKDIERSFLTEMTFSFKNRKLLAFFVAFACFCFSAMVQMSLSMRDMAGATMYYMVLGIGLVLAATTMVMAITALVRGNLKNVSVMKAFGYTHAECARAVFGGYRLFALAGFAVGTVYQYGILRFMVYTVFKDAAYGLEYGFDVIAFFITLAAFVVAYELITAVYVLKMNKISVKEIMSES